MSVPEAVGRTSYQGVMMLLLSRCPRSSQELRGSGNYSPQASGPPGYPDKTQCAGTVGYEESVDTDHSLQTEQRVWTQQRVEGSIHPLCRGNLRRLPEGGGI